jgi:hypothetical protein
VYAALLTLVAERLLAEGSWYQRLPRWGQYLPLAFLILVPFLVPVLGIGWLVGYLVRSSPSRRSVLERPQAFWFGRLILVGYFGLALRDLVADTMDIVAVDSPVEGRGQPLVNDQFRIPDDTGKVGILADRLEHQHFQDVRGGLSAHPVEDAVQVVSDATPGLAVRLSGAVDTEEHPFFIRQAKGFTAQINLQKQRVVELPIGAPQKDEILLGDDGCLGSIKAHAQRLKNGF